MRGVKRVTESVPLEEAIKRVQAAAPRDRLFRLHEAANWIWPGVEFKNNQGAARAAGKTIYAMRKQGLVLWVGSTTNWGYQIVDSTWERKEEKADKADKVFGDWVYCAEHLAAHRTGWCTVHNDSKLGLGPFEGFDDEQLTKATAKCRQLGLKLYSDLRGG